MSPTVLASTGIVTRAPAQTDHKAILEHAPRLGAAGLELMVFEQWYGHFDEVIEELRGSGLSFPVVHADKAIGSALGGADPDEVDDAFATLEVNCRAAAALGASTLVLHLWERPEGDAQLERNLVRLTDCLDTAAAYNIVLAVETIVGSAGTPLANIRMAVEHDSRCRVTLDTEFLGFHGELAASIEAEWLWAERLVRHVHLKDFDGRMRVGGERVYRLPGEGTLDLQAFLNGLAQRGYQDAITVEGSALTASGELDSARLDQVAAIVGQLSGS